MGSVCVQLMAECIWMSRINIGVCVGGGGGKVKSMGARRCVCVCVT